MYVTKIIDYLYHTLGITPEIDVFKNKNTLPLHLRSAYELFTMQLFNRTMLLARKVVPDITPSNIGKHITLLGEQTGLDTVLVLDTIDSFLRRRLIDHKISFMVPGAHLYLPLLMIDLREVYSKQRKIQEVVSPSTQFTILFEIYNSLPQPFTPKETGAALGYTKMTMSRVIDELETLSICKVEKKGKNRFAQMELGGRSLWDSIVTRLKSPVKRNVYAASRLQKLSCAKAGISALSAKTDLAADGLPVYAVSKGQFDELLYNKDIEIVEHAYRADCQIELWYYNPSFFTGKPIVDELSLFLSMKDEDDERIQLALQQLMDRFTWR